MLPGVTVEVEPALIEKTRSGHHQRFGPVRDYGAAPGLYTAVELPANVIRGIELMSLHGDN